MVNTPLSLLFFLSTLADLDFYDAIDIDLRSPARDFNRSVFTMGRHPLIPALVLRVYGNRYISPALSSTQTLPPTPLLLLTTPRKVHYCMFVMPQNPGART